MVNCFRIKEYIFPETAWNATGSQVSLSSHAINGEVLRIVAASNFTGSLAWSDDKNVMGTILVDSGTGLFTSTAYTNTTGSFVVNAPLSITCGSLSSGTGKVFGPISVYYR